MNKIFSTFWMLFSFPFVAYCQPVPHQHNVTIINKTGQNINYHLDYQDNDLSSGEKRDHLIQYGGEITINVEGYGDVECTIDRNLVQSHSLSKLAVRFSKLSRLSGKFELKCEHKRVINPIKSAELAASGMVVESLKRAF